MNSIYTRAVKFKAWHRKKKTLYTVTQINFHPGGKFEAALEGIPGKLFTDTDVELLQYTNLPDMHDQEIYEGYVLHDPEIDTYFEVLYRADRVV